MQTRPKNFVTELAAAPSDQAEAHFRRKLGFETDCWDVHAAQELEEPGFALLDVRSPEAFASGHLPGAISLPRTRITAERLAEFAEGTLFVTYCAGPHCNGSTRAALRIAQLGFPVKEMIGGTLGWVDEGFSLVLEQESA